MMRHFGVNEWGIFAEIQRKNKCEGMIRFVVLVDDFYELTIKNYALSVTAQRNFVLGKSSRFRW
jgi:hypothetical protein